MRTTVQVKAVTFSRDYAVAEPVTVGEGMACLLNTWGEPVHAMSRTATTMDQLHAVAWTRARFSLGFNTPWTWPGVVDIAVAHKGNMLHPVTSDLSTVREDIVETRSGDPARVLYQWAFDTADDGVEHVWIVFQSGSEEWTAVEVGKGAIDAVCPDGHGTALAVTQATRASGEVWHVHTHPSGNPEASQADRYAFHDMLKGLAPAGAAIRAFVAPMGHKGQQLVEYLPEKPPEQYMSAKGKVDSAATTPGGGTIDPPDEEPTEPADGDAEIHGGGVYTRSRT